MFTVEFAPGVCMRYGWAVARATTLGGAILFVEKFAPNGMGVITSYWVERDGRQVMELYDWCDCWTSDPPIIARIVAPRGFTGSGVSS